MSASSSRRYASCSPSSPARAATSSSKARPSRSPTSSQDWIEDGVADGFNLMPPVLPEMLDRFIEHVVPILQKRGLFRTAYEGRHAALAFRPVAAGRALFLINACTRWNVRCAS